jgi:hypothetical protein
VARLTALMVPSLRVPQQGASGALVTTFRPGTHVYVERVAVTSPAGRLRP